MNRLKQTIIDRVLPHVEKPGQYIGNERNAIVKDHSGVDLRVALAFPDTYSIGMSHLGLKILYHILNERPDTVAERVFAPWIDMERELRERNLPLYSLESFTPLGDFDVIGFSMQYELGFTNVLNMLELSGIPPLTSERSINDPIIIAGGSIASAMEPLVPAFDAVLVGDAEDILGCIIDAIIEWRRSPGSREELHKSLCKIQGVYVPSLYRVTFKDDGSIENIRNFDPAPKTVVKTTVSDFENSPFPTKPVVPNVNVVHDRISIEIMRGCPNQCRFCQAAMHYRPLRLRSIERVLELARQTYSNSGYGEINLTSLSSADYPNIEELIIRLSYIFDPKMVSIALPSLRIGRNLRKIPKLTSSVRKSGLTFAPEAGTEKLRNTIRKQVTDKDLLQGCQAAYTAGYRLLKLYFMIGLPGEADEDLAAIVKLSEQASLIRKRLKGKKGAINVSISSYIPKPHTSFQWEEMKTREELLAKQRFLITQRTSSSIRFKFHDVNKSFIEAVFSRGDRSLFSVLLKARQRGIRMDAWNECFNIKEWEDVFQECGINPDFHALRMRGSEEVLPWDVIALHTPKSHLLKEKGRAEEAG